MTDSKPEKARFLQVYTNLKNGVWYASIIDSDVFAFEDTEEEAIQAVLADMPKDFGLIEDISEVAV